jgi:hypothetical protein
MVVVALLREQLEAVRNDIVALEKLIAKYPFKNIDQRLRLRNYRSSILPSLRAWRVQ